MAVSTKAMELSAEAKKLYTQISQDTPKLGDLKKIAKEIKKDHELALELWSTGEYYPRLLAILIVDKNLLTQEFLDELAEEILEHDYDQRNLLSDWLLANQLRKARKTIALVETWEDASPLILRRIFWDYQARLRWTKDRPDNAADLLDALEKKIGDAEPEVQRMMNFTVAQIGIYEPGYRARCIAFGERMGLYIDEPVPRNCTSPYVPIWIDTEVAKLG